MLYLFKKGISRPCFHVDFMKNSKKKFKKKVKKKRKNFFDFWLIFDFLSFLIFFLIQMILLKILLLQEVEFEIWRMFFKWIVSRINNNEYVWLGSIKCWSSELFFFFSFLISPFFLPEIPPFRKKIFFFSSIN